MILYDRFYITVIYMLETFYKFQESNAIKFGQDTYKYFDLFIHVLI